MKETKEKKSFSSTEVILGVLMSSVLLFAMLSFFFANGKRCATETLPSGFVYLHDVVPDLQVSLRYASEENFLGRRVNGYLGNVSIVSAAAAAGLQRAQTLAKALGYELLIYDGYRPQKSVDQFVFWSEDAADPQTKKAFYYPRVRKEDAFDLGYIARKSGHTRGSTVDLTFISAGKPVRREIVPKERKLNDNSTIFFLDDGSIDMGSSFDLFDEASHTTSALVSADAQQRRDVLRDLMDRAGFDNYPNEWWHYTLRNEPFPAEYFDFDISPPSSSSSIC